MEYEYLIVGAGLFGATFAREMTDYGKKCLVIDRRSHIAGNVYTKRRENINVHEYGAHIFHTSSERVFDYISRFGKMIPYKHEVLARYKDKTFHLPFNMTTFSEMWGVNTPKEAERIIEEQRSELKGKTPQNLEEQAISLVGRDIYETLVKGYTEKQWGRSCKELPPFIIKRLPVRLEFNNDYFNDKFEAMPENGYTEIVEKMLEGIEARLDTEYADFIENSVDTFKTVVYTGAIDEFFGYKLGHLSYRTVKFDNKVLDTASFQEKAVVNYTERDVPYTRIIEHKKFDGRLSDKTIITYEYPKDFELGDEPYYPVNDEKNNALYAKYKELAKSVPNVIFGGRLGEYKYYDMDKVILSALTLCDGLLERTNLTT